MKECMICGNKKASEIEPALLHSDGDGNEAEEIQYFCKEGKGCA